MTDKDLYSGGVVFGNTPALIVVDMTLGFTSSDSPLGGHFDECVSAAVSLVDAFRQHGLPVFFSSVAYGDDKSMSVFRRHLPDLNILQSGSHWVLVDPRFGCVANSQVINKGGPSAFFDTDLAEKLKAANSDSLIVCGLTTSGCVRATVVDALQHNYPTWVVSDACGDRNQSAHHANLHDMHAKYAQVVTAKDALSHLNNFLK